MRIPQPIKNRSERTIAEAPLRAACIRIVTARCKGRCEARTEVCTGDVRDVHELVPRSAGRRSGTIFDPANCLGVCRACHNWIGDHPATAMELRLKVSRYEGRRS